MLPEPASRCHALFSLFSETLHLIVLCGGKQESAPKAFGVISRDPESVRDCLVPALRAERSAPTRHGGRVRPIGGQLTIWRRETRAVFLRLRFERCLPARRARRLAENCRAAVSRSGRILPKANRDHFAHRANARKVRALPFRGRCDANRRPARMSTAEKRLHLRAIHPRHLLRADSEGRNHLA